jgi:hypothetical protein
LPGYYFKQGIEDANKEARRQAIAATAFGTVILLPEVASVCLANPVACNQAGITASEVLSEGGVVAGGAVATKTVAEEAAALKQAAVGAKKAVDEIGAAKQAANPSLKKASGDLESAANSARTQPHSNGEGTAANSTTLDLLKNAERTPSGALKVDNATLQQIGAAESQGGKAFSGLDAKILQDKPATWHGELTGGRQTVIKYVDPATGQTKFTVHTVTDGAGNVVHRDFDSVLIQSGQQVVK